MVEKREVPRTLGELLKENSCFIAAGEFRNLLYRVPDGSLVLIDAISVDTGQVRAQKIGRPVEGPTHLIPLKLRFEEARDFVPIYSFLYKCPYSDLCEQPQSSRRV